MSGPRSAKVVKPDGGTWLWWLGHPLRYLALGEDTGDAYALSWGTVPAGGGPPPHRHTFHEGFYVLRGEVTFTAGDRSVRLPAGGFVNVAVDTAHYLKNTGPGEAELLVVVGPAGFDRFQREAGRPLTHPGQTLGPPTDDDLARLRAAAPKYGIDLDPPPEAFARPPRVAVKQPGEGRCVAAAGDLYTFLAVGEDTDGAYALWDALVPPGGGPPPHRHSREEEAFYVLEGELAFQSDGQKTTAGPGTFVHLPRGTLHFFKNEGSRPARTLILVAPAGLEKMFQTTGQPWPDRSQPPPPMGPEEVQRLLATAPKFGVEIVPPEGHGGEAR